MDGARKLLPKRGAVHEDEVVPITVIGVESLVDEVVVIGGGIRRTSGFP